MTYKSNVTSAYHVLESATALSLESVVLPSSINPMGAFFRDAPPEGKYLPVDEAHPVTSRDPYAVGKHAMEVTTASADGPTHSSRRRKPNGYSAGRPSTRGATCNRR